MSVPMSQVLATARTYLNDDSASFTPDPVLIPKVQEAHREMQTKLWMIGSPIVRGVTTFTVVASAVGSQFGTLPADLLFPFFLQEAPSPAGTPMVSMTEIEYVHPSSHIYSAGPTLVYWSFDFVGTFLYIWFQPCAVDRVVNMQYRRLITIPVLVTDVIGVLFGELYLAPRAAAIQAEVLGNKALADALTQQAEENFGDIITANRGQQKPMERP